MPIKLNRSLCLIDLETTGVDVATARIVEIAILKINPDNSRSEFVERLNPGVPIPPESTEFHKITDEDIKNAPTFAQVAASVIDFIEDADMAGYNSNKFDIPVLAEEFLRAGIDFDFRSRRFIDVQNIFHKMEQRTLFAAYKFYCNKELINAHSAKADIEATWEILEAQVERYSELKNDVSSLSEFSKGKVNFLDHAQRIAVNEKNEAIINFGKHKGKRVMDVFKSEPSYYSWMMNGDFPLYTKKVITDIKNSMS
ncbi:MAG: exonuclease domain-containing protein [Flavobacteriales bacterium]